MVIVTMKAMVDCGLTRVWHHREMILLKVWVALSGRFCLVFYILRACT